MSKSFSATIPSTDTAETGSETAEMVEEESETAEMVEGSDDDSETAEMVEEGSDDDSEKVSQSDLDESADSGFSAVVSDIENGESVTADMVTFLVPLFIEATDPIERLDRLQRSTQESWLENEDLESSYMTITRQLSQVTKEVRSAMPDKPKRARRGRTSAAKVSDPKVAALLSAQLLTRGIEMVEDIKSSLEKELTAAMLTAGVTEVTPVDMGVLTKRTTEAFRAVSDIGKVGKQNKPNLFVKSTNWHHTDRDGSVHTLAIDEENVWTLDGAEWRNGADDIAPSSSGAASQVNGGKSQAGANYWHPGVSA